MNDRPFIHPGEQAMHQRAMLGDKAKLLSQRLVADHMSAQQQAFFPMLSTLYITSIDEQERPWASILVGQPGFVSVVDEKHLCISNLQPVWSDPLHDNIHVNQALGLLGLDFKTRRRNRLSGNIIQYENRQLQIKITQAFGNCPKYIQSRQLQTNEAMQSLGQEKQVQQLSHLNGRAKQIIQASDTFFIASYYPYDGQQSADISHRGGQPGFVKVENEYTLSFDDFAGNNLYMTLGNLLSHPFAGLLFIDFETGDLLQISCHADIIDTPHARHARRLRMTIEGGRLIKAALPVRWQFLDYSLYLPPD